MSHKHVILINTSDVLEKHHLATMWNNQTPGEGTRPIIGCSDARRFYTLKLAYQNSSIRSTRYVLCTFKTVHSLVPVYISDICLGNVVCECSSALYPFD